MFKVRINAKLDLGYCCILSFFCNFAFYFFPTMHTWYYIISLLLLLCSNAHNFNRMKTLDDE